MADFKDMVAGMPGLKDLTAAAQEGLAERVTAEILGYHRWPFLLQVQEQRTWAANSAIQKLPGIFRIWNIMFPDSGGDYYRLTELSDIEFQNWIELNPDSTDTEVWRDAGMDGNDMRIELYSVPSSSKVLKIDYTKMVDFSDIDSLPFRFQQLILSGMTAAIGNYGAKRAYQDELQLAVAREMDLQGKRSHVGKDIVQASRQRNINSPG